MNEYSVSCNFQEKKLASEVNELFCNLFMCFTFFQRVIAIDRKSSTETTNVIGGYAHLSEHGCKWNSITFLCNNDKGESKVSFPGSISQSIIPLFFTMSKT